MTEETNLDKVADSNPLDSRFDEELERSLSESRGYMGDRERTLTKLETVKVEEPKQGEAEATVVTKEPKTKVVEPVEQVIEEHRIDPETITDEELAKLFPKFQSKRDKEIAALKKERDEAIQRANQYVAPVNNLMKPVTPIEPSIELGEAPPKPTKEDWEEDQGAAMEKFYAHKQYVERKEQLERDKENRNRTLAEQAEIRRQDWLFKYDNSIKETNELYPDATNKDSELFKKACQILARDGRRANLDPNSIPDIISPYADSDSIRLAAHELGIQPKGKEVLTKPATKPIFLIGGKTGTGIVEPHKVDTDEDLANKSTYDLAMEFKREAGLIT
jgi:hypothetical protein